MCHVPESQGQMGFGTDLVQALAKQVICFHSQSDLVTCFRSQSWAVVHCCDLTLVMAGVSAEVPSIHLNFIWATCAGSSF